ncbi:hypothetical protein DE146DRAFT_153038 [Phaeosphaeria sp. MPI-PUGE-AT-0046c]|nr:hypothetical protein DE146DRAFT_153038 [Phaeosphaeria sp. MPI-PUGE-AT-0046c]
MNNDLNKTFGQIFDNDVTALREQLVDIQQYQADRNESVKWAHRLRFLDISNVPDLARLEQDRSIRSTTYDEEGRRVQTPGLRPKLTIPIVEEDEDDDEEPDYLAVSWKWVDLADHIPYGCGSRESFRYYIQRRPGCKPHASSFPDRYMDRVILMAQSHGINKIWIDTECIYQRPGDDPRDKELGVQVMDLVYEDARLAVGLLTTPLMLQDEVDTLARLMLGTISATSEDSNSDVSLVNVDIAKVQMLILRILSDPRWSRAWIFQEDHLAAYRMMLLVPHSPHVRTNRVYGFGNIHGDLQVNVARFRASVTAFCLAQPDIRRWPSNEILQKAKRYKMFNTISSEAYPSTTNSVLVDVCTRSIKEEQDRVAILANALQFSSRLDTTAASSLITSGKYSLSAVLLALILMNGEILHNCDDILEHTVLSYVEHGEYLIRAPYPDIRQFFFDHCRFRSPKITLQGVETQGWIFALLPDECVRLSAREIRLLRPTYLDEASLDREKGSILDEAEQDAVQALIYLLIDRWPRSRLANHMQRCLNFDRDPSPSGAYPAVLTVIKMMAAVVRALHDGCEVRLARLHSRPESSEPSAMFILPGGWSDNAGTDPQEQVLIFTSWDDPQHLPHHRHSQERLVSLRVSGLSTSDDISSNDVMREGCSLKKHGWLNGIWDARGERLGTYLFPFDDKPHGELQYGAKRKKNTDSSDDELESDDDLADIGHDAR